MHILDRPPPPPGQRLDYGQAPEQFAELRVPEGNGPHPVIVALHGGFWRARYDLLHLGHLCVALTAAGFATLSLEYRRVGQAGGGYPGTLDDTAAGFALLDAQARANRLDRSRVVSLGHSAGGQLALWLAHRSKRVRHPLRGAVGLAAVSDLAQAFALNLGNGIVPEFLGGTPTAVPEHYADASPAALLPLGVPQVLVHGSADDTVPIAMSEAYVARAKASGDAVTLTRLEGADHFEPIDPESAAWPAVLSAVRRLL